MPQSPVHPLDPRHPPSPSVRDARLAGATTSRPPRLRGTTGARWPHSFTNAPETEPFSRSLTPLKVVGGSPRVRGLPALDPGRSIPLGFSAGSTWTGDG